jgi:enoyl-CoA hydratase
MSLLQLVLRRPFAELRLVNPDNMNALTVDMLAQLFEHCDVIERRTDIRAVILTAEGDRAFCAGADLSAWSDVPPPDYLRHWVRDGHRIFDRLARLSKPTIAAITGHAFGGGLELAAACDIRVMHPGAVLALSEAGIGVGPGWSGTQRLSRLLPEAVLKDMALFGRKLTAERAYALGFVAEVDVDPRGGAERIAAGLLNAQPRSTELTKYMIHAAVGEDRAALIEALSSGVMPRATELPDGVANLADHRKPDLTGV